MLVRHTLMGIFALSSLSFSAYSMDKPQIKVFKAQPLTKFPDCIYDGAFQGATYNFSENKKRFLQTGILASTLTREKARQEKLNEEGCVIFDWFFALQKCEATLLQKPCVTWTINNLKELSSWLTRLDYGPNGVDVPGTFRTKGSVWQIKENVSTLEFSYANQLQLRKEHTYSAQALEQWRASEQYKALPPQARAILEEPLTDEEEEKLCTIIHSFPVPETIEAELTDALKSMQQAMKKIADLSLQERQEKVLSLSAKFHYDIVRIHPFKEGSKRLGRLCMYLINAQHGIAPVHFTDGKAYLRALMKSLQLRSSAPFENHIRKVYDLPHEEDVAAASVRMCTFCGQQPEKLLACSHCKSVQYCSAQCQAQDWKAGHKSSCTAKK